MAWWKTKMQVVGKEPTDSTATQGVSKFPHRSRLVSPSQGASRVAKPTELKTTLCYGVWSSRDFQQKGCDDRWQLAKDKRLCILRLAGGGHVDWGRLCGFALLVC